MKLRADFSKREVVRPEDYRWADSPVPGVERMMLDRIGDEVARATSLVRYAPNSEFPAHSHGGGEEILVLDGEFADDHGRYPAGTYLRNPVGTQHAPLVGAAGATIFVKLHQFDPADQRHFALDTTGARWQPGLVDGLEVLSLHAYGREQVALVRWAPDTQFQAHTHRGGEEVFVVDGCFRDEHGAYPAGTWLRNPDGSRHAPFTEQEGALIYVKVGHLAVPGERDAHA